MSNKPYDSPIVRDFARYCVITVFEIKLIKLDSMRTFTKKRQRIQTKKKCATWKYSDKPACLDDDALITCT